MVHETIEKIVAQLMSAAPESETATPLVFEQLSIEEIDELTELVVTFCALIGYEMEGRDLDVKVFIQALSQVFPSLKPISWAADLERDGTREAKRQYQRGRDNDLSGTMTRVSRIIGMLVLLRSFAILPVDFHYQI